MSESTNQRKRKSKGKWFGNSKKAKYSICPGQKGFLVFCNNREKEAIKEARVLFDEFSMKNQEEHVENSSEDEFDALEAEQNELKKEKEESGEKFKLMNTGVQNVLFFKSKLSDPVKFSLEIMDEILKNGEQKTRFLMRLIPVEITCKAYNENVTEAVKKLISKHFSKDQNQTYSVVFKSRCNQEFTKESAVKIVNDIIKEESPNSKVEYKNPDLVIMVEVMKGNCCLGILPRYFDHYKKYNLIELANKKADKEISTE